VYCSVLQCGAIGDGNELLDAFAAGKLLQCVTVCCSVLQYVAVGARNKLLAVFASSKLLKYVAVYCSSVLQCVEGCLL